MELFQNPSQAYDHLSQWLHTIVNHPDHTITVSGETYQIHHKSLLATVVFLTWLVLYRFYYWFFFSRMANKPYDLSLYEKQKEEIHTKYREKTFPVCPMGWYTLCFADELIPGETVKSFVVAGDLEVVAYRRESDGQPVVLHPYCSHLGAFLGVGAKLVAVDEDTSLNDVTWNDKVKSELQKVANRDKASSSNKKDCIQCPFHHWRFDKDGKCANIPYSSKEIPKNAHIQSYPVKLWCNRVVMFYHPNQIEPVFDLPSEKEFEGMTYMEGDHHGTKEYTTHVAEIMENCSDPVHFQSLHYRPWMPFGINKGFTLVHHIDCLEEEYKLTFLNKPEFKVLGFSMPEFTSADVDTTFVGMTQMIFRFTNKYLGRIVLVKSLTQATNTLIIQRDSFYVDKTIPSPIAWFVMQQATHAFEEDFVVWLQKEFKPKPLVVDGDGDIMRRRRWMKRFLIQKDNIEW